MDALDQSDELMRACAKLRARSARMRADAAKTREKSRQLVAVATEAQERVLRGYDTEPARGSHPGDLPAGW